MYDQSFSTPSLSRELRRVDFRNHSFVSNDAFKEAVLCAAVEAANGIFPRGLLLEHFQAANNRDVCHLASISDQLVVRKLTRNIRRLFRMHQWSRDAIIMNLTSLLSEGLKYRIYRIDIKSFYASFDQNDVIDQVKRCTILSPLSFSILAKLMVVYKSIGGIGLPTGLSISATLADFMMRDFDARFRNDAEIYFYARYVDDILILTNGNEKPKAFMRYLKSALPNGLALNSCKTKIVDSPQKAATPSAAVVPLKVDYLGYTFTVNDVPDKNKFRIVNIDMSSRRERRLKTRISRAFISYTKDRDFALLESRIQFLTSNYMIFDPSTGNRILAGIYVSFRHITCKTSSALNSLDRFLRISVLSKNGRISSITSSLFTGKQKRRLLTCSFVRGHSGACQRL